MPNTPQAVPSEGPYTMTEDELRKRLTQRHHGRYITQFYAALIASTGAFSFGTLVGWSSPNLSQLKFTDIFFHHHSWIASMVPLGCTVGLAPWSYFQDRIGPKRCLMIQGPLTVLCWVVMALVTDFKLFIAGRFFSGFLSISYMVNGESLLADSVHAGNLEHFVVFFRSSIYLGIMATYVAAQLIETSVVTGGCAFVCACHLALVIFAPDSPVFLFDKDTRKAEAALCWYRGQHNIFSEMQKIQHDSMQRKQDQEATSSMMYAETVLRGLFIILGLIFFKVFTGYYVFLFYGVDAVSGSRQHNYMGHLVHSYIYVIVLFFASLFGTLLHQKLPFGARRPLILSSSLVMVLLLLMTLYLYLPEFLPDLKKYRETNWVVLICCSAFAVSYEIGYGSYPDKLVFHYMPYQVHLRVKFITRIVHWSLIFICVKYFPTLQESLRSYLYVPFAFLTIIAMCGVVYCTFLVVEVKDRSLVQIQIDIGGNPVGNRGAYRRRTKTEIYDI